MAAPVPRAGAYRLARWGRGARRALRAGGGGGPSGRLVAIARLEAHHAVNVLGTRAVQQRRLRSVEAWHTGPWACPHGDGSAL